MSNFWSPPPLFHLASATAGAHCARGWGSTCFKHRLVERMLSCTGWHWHVCVRLLLSQNSCLLRWFFLGEFKGGPRGRGRVGPHLRAWFALVLLTLLCLVVFLFFCHRGGHGVSMRQSVKNYGSPLWWSGLLQFMINVALRLCVSCFLCFNNDALCSCICLAF